MYFLADQHINPDGRIVYDQYIVDRADIDAGKTYIVPNLQPAYVVKSCGKFENRIEQVLLFPDNENRQYEECQSSGNKHS
jgi:hypothetical protein